MRKRLAHRGQSSETFFCAKPFSAFRGISELLNGVGEKSNTTENSSNSCVLVKYSTYFTGSAVRVSMNLGNQCGCAAYYYFVAMMVNFLF